MPSFRRERKFRSRTKTVKTIVSASGHRLIARHKGDSRVVVSFIDRDGRLICKANFDSTDWSDFCS